MAMQIIRGERFDLRDEKSAFGILDSMGKAMDQTTREFYFWLVTRSMEHADGYYSEGLSHSGYRLFDSLPCEFLSHFVELECLRGSDLDNWSEYLEFEFFLGEDAIASGKVDRAHAWIRNKCRKCSRSEKAIAERIILNINGSVDGAHPHP